MMKLWCGTVVAVTLGVLLVGCADSVSPPSRQPTPTPAPTATPVPGQAFNMTLLSQVDLATIGASSAAGNWGYTSPGGRRLALTGTSAGLSIVEVTDPRKPQPIALIPGASSLWREVRTYRHYAYVTTEARTGLDIVDLSDPSNPRKVQTWSQTFTSAHSLWIDTQRGLLFAHGTKTPAGAANGMRILALEPDPENPREVGSFSGFYIHDSYTRGNTLYAAAISDGFLGILDVADPANVRETTRFFTGGRFTHNAWLTNDGRYLFTTDERSSRPVEGWDISIPTAPRKVSEYIGAPGSIPHNVLIDGNRLYIAHYTEGVHVLDIVDPERPRLLGSYDTYLGTGQGFFGAWGVYVFPGTDLVLVGDMQGGLFVVAYTGR